jgi:hypothetical protein
METWKDIKCYEGLYQVSNLGRVKALSKLKTSRNKNGVFEFITKEIILNEGYYQGYARVVLTKDGIRSTKKVHRLVASAFLGDEPNKCVNHIDFNRSNNCIDNLEWTTVIENNLHSRRNNRYPKNKMSDLHKNILKELMSKKVICLETLCVYDSIKIAAAKLNFKESTLRHYLIGSRKNKTSLIYLKDYKS